MTYPRDYVACGGEPHDDMQLTDSAAAAAERPGRTVIGREVSANFPPFFTLPEDNAFSLKRGEPLEVVAARPDAGRSLLVQDIVQLEQRLIAQGLAAGAEGAPTYYGMPIIENKFLPPDTVYIVTDSASTASLIAALSDVLPMMGKKS